MINFQIRYVYFIVHFERRTGSAIHQSTFKKNYCTLFYDIL